MKGIPINHKTTADLTEGEENRYDHNVQAEEALGRSALVLSLLQAVLRRRYSAVVPFHHSIVEGVQTPQILRIRTIVLVPMCLSDLFSPRSMCPVVARQWENGLLVIPAVDSLINSMIFLPFVVVPSVFECSLFAVDCELVTWESNFIAVVGAVNAVRLFVGLSVAVASVDVVIVWSVV
jgi:hypothetical protein